MSTLFSRSRVCLLNWFASLVQSTQPRNGDCWNQFRVHGEECSIESKEANSCGCSVCVYHHCGIDYDESNMTARRLDLVWLRAIF